MKASFNRANRRASGHALLMVITMAAVSAMILAGTLKRTYTESQLNNRNNQFMANQNAAEAAAEKVYAMMAFDFQRYGLGRVIASNSTYRVMIPDESAYWNNFEFVDPVSGASGQIYVQANGVLGTNSMPSQYANRIANSNSPIYRIVVNVRQKNGMVPTMTNAFQEDVLLAYVPLTTYAIFYNGRLEFTKCATMTINGTVHANGPIYTGAGSGATLTFNGDVSSTSTIGPYYNDGINPPGATYFKGAKITNAPSVNIPINMTNARVLIEFPTNTTPSYANSTDGQQLLYNQANVILLVSNTTVTALLHVGTASSAPGADTGEVMSTNNTPEAINAMFPFLTVTNKFKDDREYASKTAGVVVSQIDLGKYQQWLTTDPVASVKFPASSPATVLFVADNRTTNISTTLYAVRVTNGVAPPKNGGLGFTMVTPNPLYVWGNYNCPSNSTVGNTNTYAAGTVPCALMCDALTLLSSKWQDTNSTAVWSSRDPLDITVNAALLTGAVYSTGTNKSQFSGGVHNLPRLLEDWQGAGKTVTLNTSIINLFNSKVATNKFIDPGDTGCYYSAPTRVFSYDNKFRSANQQPPGMPCALIPIRYNWAQPPPKTVTYNVTP